MRDPSGIVFAAMLLTIATVLLLGTVARLRRRKPAAKAEEQVRIREEAQIRKLVDAGSHIRLSDGRVAPKCVYCNEEATKRPYKWVRDAGMMDLIRRKFGAPARVRVGRDEWAENMSCEAHDPLVYEEFRMENGQYEVDRARLESEWETRRARFQREGVHERVRQRISDHEKEIDKSTRGRRRRSEAPSKVVPFSGSSRTGTDGK